VSTQDDVVSCALFCWKYIHAFHVLWYTHKSGGGSDATVDFWLHRVEGFGLFSFKPNDVVSLRTLVPNLIRDLSNLQKEQDNY
jgi:hypothetical protein